MSNNLMTSVVPVIQYMEIMATSIKTDPSNVNKKNLKAEYTLFGPPQIPIIKNIGMSPPSKNK